MNFEEVTEKYPTLSYRGFKPGEPLKHHVRIDFTVQWLRENFKPNKKPGHGIQAYVLKHRMQEEPHGTYTSEGEFVCAALMAGFPVSKDGTVAISSKSMLDYDLKRVGHLSFTERFNSDVHLLKWDMRYHYKWDKMKHDKSIPDDYVESLKIEYPTLTRDGFNVMAVKCDLDLPSIRKASGWLRTMGFLEDLSDNLFTPDDTAVAMEKATNFYPHKGNMIAAIMWLKITCTKDFEVRFNARSMKKIDLANRRVFQPGYGRVR